jgi:hypothetical protein
MSDSNGKGSGPRDGQHRRPFPEKSLAGLFWDNRSPQEKYEDNWELIWGKRDPRHPDVECQSCHCQSRLDGSDPKDWGWILDGDGWICKNCKHTKYGYAFGER